MKVLIVVLPVIGLLSCHNSNDKSATTDSIVSKTNAVNTVQNVSVDTTTDVYCYITAVEKVHDSVMLKADYVEFFNGPNVLEEAKKRHRADTSFDKSGKITDIFVPDDYFIVNDNKTLRALYLQAGAPITMDSQIAGNKNKEINNYDYFSKHYANSLFLLKVKKNSVEAVKEVFLP